jgi:hypothetical protein
MMLIVGGIRASNAREGAVAAAKSILGPRAEPADGRGRLVLLRPHLGWKERVTLLDDGSEIAQFASTLPGLPAQHFESLPVADLMTFHQDSLSALDLRPASEGAFEASEIREAVADDLDRGLKLVRLIAGDVTEDPASGSFRDEGLVVRAEDGYHGTDGLVNDPRDQLEGVLGAVGEADKRNVRLIPASEVADLFDGNVPRDHFVTETDDDPRQLFELCRDFACDQGPEPTSLLHERHFPTCALR